MLAGLDVAPSGCRDLLRRRWVLVVLLLAEGILPLVLVLDLGELILSNYFLDGSHQGGGACGVLAHMLRAVLELEVTLSKMSRCRDTFCYVS